MGKTKEVILYVGTDIVFQEVPNEVSLVFSLSKCPNRCKGCHSQHLTEAIGKELTDEVFRNEILKRRNYITTVLFFGGDGQQNRLMELAKIAKELSFKVAVYSGLNELNKELVEVVDYYKIGRYVQELGGLNSRNTNQRFYKKVLNELVDYTELFTKESSNEKV